MSAYIQYNNHWDFMSQSVSQVFAYSDPTGTASKPDRVVWEGGGLT